MKVSLDLKEIGEICAAHLRAKGYTLDRTFRINIDLVHEKVQLVFDVEKG